jgi:RNA polymerase sporulation-specific sigma factor
VAEDCDLLEQVAVKEQAAQLRQAIDKCLSSCEKQVILLRYGLSGKPPQRQREVAEVTGLSRSYISRVEKRALQKLRQELEK